MNDRTKPRPSRPPRERERTPALVPVSGAIDATVIRLAEGATILGRGDVADIQLADNGLSRAHAKCVRTSDGRVSLLDLGSTNGTYVNGERIEVAWLQDGDEVRLGTDVVLRFTCDPPVEPSPAGSESRAPHPLTTRELEVARLVAEGLTSQEIAERLGLKLRTVTSHLDHIYARLGIGSRAMLARWVVESGLLPAKR